MTNAMQEKILVHCCCGPCSTSSIQRLLEEGYQPVLCYGNSNIWPREENDKRYGELLKVSQYYGGLEVFRVDYDHDSWLEFIKGLEAEPEHGKRCLKCFEFNLREAYKIAKKLGIKLFTTTLTVSRFKKSEAIFAVGEQFEGFTKIDFKKKDGFANSVKLSKQLGLYRQGYCGCEFSFASAQSGQSAQSSAASANSVVSENNANSAQSGIVGGQDAKCN